MILTFNYGLINLRGEVILKPGKGEPKIMANNNDYFAIVSENKYGLVNSFGSTTLDFNYDYIYVGRNYIFTVKDKKLIIYNLVLEPVGKEYTVNENIVEINEFSTYYY